MFKNLDKLFKLAKYEDQYVTDRIKWLLKNQVLKFRDNSTKWGDPIPFDIRAEGASSTLHMNSLGELLADKVISIEKEQGVRFDSMFCSLYCGMFTGFSTALWLDKKYNRQINLAVGRRDFRVKLEDKTDSDFLCIQCKARAPYESLFWSSHPKKDKNMVGTLEGNVLIHDEMVNSGNTVRELADICRMKNAKPKAIMVIADRILDPLPKGVHERMIDQIPCYSMITHYELIEWCNNNQKICKALDDPT